MCDDFCWEGGRGGQLYRNATDQPRPTPLPRFRSLREKRVTFHTIFHLITSGSAGNFISLSFLEFQSTSQSPRRSGKISPAPDSSRPTNPPCVVTFHGAAAAGVVLARTVKVGEIRTFHYTAHRKRAARRFTVPGTVRLNPFFVRNPTDDRRSRIALEKKSLYFGRRRRRRRRHDG